MSSAELLAIVRACGAEAFVREGNVILRPASVLEPGLIDELRRHKAELLAHLQRADYEYREEQAIGPCRPPGLHRRCLSCNGGLQRDDPDFGRCSTCAWSMHHLQTTRVQ